MNFNDDKEDFFDREIEHVEKPVKEPELSPDDPRYWEQPESEFEHLKPLTPVSHFSWKWVAAGAIVVVGVILFVYFRYFSPYVEEATQYGYVEHIERRGTLFKTYEGVLIPYKEIKDTTRVYKQDFLFSAEPKAAVTLHQMQHANKPVRVTYKRYHASVPWRGDSEIIVEQVDSVDPVMILPPEYLPEVK